MVCEDFKKQRFIFELYDIDFDGILTSIDVVNILGNVVPSSVIGEEI